MDPGTGVITGRAIASDPEGAAIEYGLANPFDAIYADISIDPDTGEFSFAPADLARYLAAVDTKPARSPSPSRPPMVSTSRRSTSPLRSFLDTPTTTARSTSRIWIS